MERWTMAVPCLFGLEGLVGDELRRMGMEDVRVEDRRVVFTGGSAELARANIGLRMGERVMILLARFPARSFEELYQGVKAIPLERFVPREGAFPVKGYSLDSQLHSVPDCQSIVKKAAVDHLGAHYGLTWLPETGETYQLRFSIMKDLCEVFLDSSGVSLHKRGYRAVGNEAPLHETMAAAMVNLARYRGRDFFWDPFCGSGTIVIEAALAALNRAPGKYIEFREADATRESLPCDHGVIVCNPPYGERMLEQRSAQQLMRQFGRHLRFADGWKKYIISSEPEFEHYFGKQATKKRKLYNGRLQCNVYMYF